MSKQEYIQKTIEQYLKGDISESQWKEFLEENKQDPFLMEAAEGLEKHRPSVERLEAVQEQVTQRASGSSFPYAGLISAVSIAALFVVVFIFLDPFENQVNELAEQAPKEEKLEKEPAVEVEDEEEVEKPIVTKEIAEQEMVEKSEVVETVPAPEVDEVLIEEMEMEAEAPQESRKRMDYDAPQPMASIPSEAVGQSTPRDKRIMFARGSDKFIHDYKVVDYSEFDFKIKHRVDHNYEGTKAVFANKNGKYETKEQLDMTIMKVQYDDYFEYIFKLIDGREYKEALRSLKKVEEVNPTDLNVLFYRAFCYYNMGRNREAIPLLKKIIQIGQVTFKQESNWFLALNYIEIEDEEAAREVLNEIVAKNDFYANKARAKLRELDY